ncbi:MAG: tetratricopeptide repeat protein [Polyangiaceae bacterium]|nr:tetratricopeptide repeat protein [Polyangiaceae bacterium]
MNEGVDYQDAGAYSEAIEAFREAIALDPTHFGPWYDLGLLYKKTRDWPQALDAFLRAWSRVPPGMTAELYAAILWNTGIAASALRVWPYARKAWHSLGYSLDPLLNEPPSLPLGPVWVCFDPTCPMLGQRLDPARARIASGAEQYPQQYPSPGAVVVHDAERVASQVHEGVELPVFPILHVEESTPGVFEQYREDSSKAR